MKAEIAKKYRFEAAHSLPHVPEGHQCGRVHGHSYELEVVLEGDIDNEAGWVMDFGALSHLVKPLTSALDHRLLNDIGGLENPTSERLSRWFWLKLAADVPALKSVSISETATSRATYRGDDA